MKVLFLHPEDSACEGPWSQQRWDLIVDLGFAAPSTYEEWGRKSGARILSLHTSADQGEGYQWVGDHIRPRVRVPEEWHWPVGVSLSMEVGYQRRSYSTDTWTWEIRPIIDKQIKRWYLSFNPTLDRSFHGFEVNKGVTFSPNVKVSYDVTKKVTVGFEYYGAVGSITGFDPLRDQQQAIMPALDLNLSPNWEFNLAAGVGVTGGTDHLLVKMILGRRFNFGRK